MADGDSEVEPKVKKRKTDEYDDPIFVSFWATEKKKELEIACHALDMGFLNMTLGVLHVDSSNALDQVSFRNSTIKTSPLNMKPGVEGKPKGGVVGDIFIHGLDVLKKYLDKESPQVPDKELERKSLQKLLTFLTFKEDHEVLFDDAKGEAKWAVTLAQHLLSKLSVSSTYTIVSYKDFTNEREPLCLCREHDKLIGKVGNNSFGCQNGWHGEPDIIMGEVTPVSVFDEGTIIDEPGEAEDLSVSSVEVKVQSDNFQRQEITQIMAQTIVFSFLQRKLNKEKLKNHLIPGIGFTKKNMIVCFFDSEFDVLLQSRAVEIYNGNTINFPAILLLWLTLNYRLFCSGVTEEMKEHKCDFIKGLGLFGKVYFDEVAKPVNIPHTTKEELFPWSENPRPCENRISSDLTYRKIRCPESSSAIPKS